MEKRIIFRLMVEQYTKLKQLAEDWDVSLSGLLREIISQWLDEQAKANDGEIATHLR